MAFPDHNQFKVGIFPRKDPDSFAYAVIRLFSTLGPEAVDRGIPGSRAIGHVAKETIAVDDKLFLE